MFKGLKHLTGRDKMALAVFFAIALLGSLYFASGILVTYVSSPSDAIEMAQDGTGYTVRVLGLQTYNAAEQLSNALREQRRIKTVIEGTPADGYLIKIGPLAKREAAETLTTELHGSGYNLVKIVDNCPAGSDCNPSTSLPAQPNPTPPVQSQNK